MTLTDSEKRRIVTRSRTLQSRLETPLKESIGSSAEDTTDWIDEWKDRVADGDSRLFERRLGISNVEGKYRRRIGVRNRPLEGPFPEWIERLDDFLSFVEAGDYSDRNVDSDVAFVHVLDVFVEYASKQIDWASSPESVSRQTIDGFEGWLLDRLQDLFAHTLFIEFKTFLGTHDEELAFGDASGVSSDSSDYYERFVTRFLEDDVTSFFEEYCVLARLSMMIIGQWIEVVEEFLSRLRSDYQALERRFSSNGDLGAITDIDFLGDPHQGGRMVSSVTFESGTKIAYNPRDIEIEEGFYEFLAWINRTSSFGDFYTITFLPRETYGWMEWVEPEPCSSTAEVEEYYHRAGMLLCLLYVLNFTDGHLENLIAMGDQPMLVDLETIVNPKPPVDTTDVNDVTASIWDSVLRTGFLPIHQPNGDKSGIQGLSTTEGKVTGVEKPDFENVNSDLMELKFRNSKTIEADNFPRLDGERVTPDEHHEQISEGFERMYTFLLDNRNEILSDGGPIELFEGTKTRYLYRSTDRYGGVLRPLLTPEYLRTGLQFGCKAEELAKPFVTGRIDSEMWPVYEAERTSLWRCDIPRFTVDVSGKDLVHDEYTIENVFRNSPLEQLRTRIETLSKADCREQLDYITLAYNSLELSHPEPDVSSTIDTTTGREVEELVHQNAREIFERVRETASRTRDGNVRWNIRMGRQDGIYTHPIANDFYEGRVGVGLFSAALANVFDEQVYMDFTREVLSPLVETVTEDGSFPDERIGAGHGLGSLVYGFTRIGELLDDDQLVAHAQRTASVLTPERINEDEVFDALGGSAGAIFGLLALYGTTGDDEILNRAVAAGDHLLANRSETGGVRVWQTINDEQPIAGMSHGVAGIAYALFRLTDASGEQRFQRAALESLDFERQVFSQEHQNWPDLREATETDFMDGWCSGRAGIGLSRLGMLEIDDRTELRTEVDDAARGLDPETLLDRDHLCCGNFGRVEFLMRASRTFDDVTYLNRARQIAAASARRAEANDGFIIPWQTEEWYNPTFFAGESGIGYTLLRLTNPELPCPLLWE